MTSHVGASVLCNISNVDKLTVTNNIATDCLYGDYGIHIWDVSVYRAICTSTVVYNYLGTVFNTPALGFLKVSVFLIIFSLFWPKKYIRWSVYVGCVVIAIFYGTITIYQFIISTPRPGISWTTWIVTGPEMTKGQLVSLPTGIFGLIIDVYLLLLPVPAVLDLQMPRKKKLGVLSVFATGLLACVASGVGIHYRLVLESPDTSWNTIDLGIMLQLEMNAGIIIVSTPAISKVFTQYLPSLEVTWSKVTSRLGLLRSRRSHTQLDDGHPEPRPSTMPFAFQLDNMKRHDGSQVPLPTRAVTIET